MRTRHALDRALAPALAAALLALTGCGPLTIRTWVTVIPEQSSGSVSVNDQPPVAIQRLRGGFLAKVRVDTTQLLTGPLQGTIELEDVRIAGFVPFGVGMLCAWGDPDGSSAGTVTLDLNGGTSSADLVLDLKAYTRLSEIFGLDPNDLEQPVTFALGSGLSLETLTGALVSGSADGFFATRAAFVGDSEIAGLPVTFGLDLGVTNGARPPLFDSDQLTFCGPLFEEQGVELFYALNSKGSYLRAKPGDEPAAPLVISLAELGAAPGDVLRIATVGTYSDATLIKDGSDRRTSAVFSATPDLRGAGERHRVPGAIDAGPDVSTASWLECVFLFCKLTSSDVGQDFRVDPRVDVTVPVGANYLIVAPLSPSHVWEDDSGFGFGVDVSVNPAP
jgi:hypothetical protein